MRLGRGMAIAAEEQELPVSNLMLGVILFCIVFGMCLTFSLQHCWQRHRGASMQPSRKCKDTGRLCDSSEDEDRNSASGLVQSTGSAVRHTRKKRTRACTSQDCSIKSGSRIHMPCFSTKVKMIARCVLTFLKLAKA